MRTTLGRPTIVYRFNFPERVPNKNWLMTERDSRATQDTTRRTKKVLFICWDAHHVTYLEGLFLPIFERLAKMGFEFHVIQFSWASPEKVAHIGRVCKEKSICYLHVPVALSRMAVFGKFVALLRGPGIISRYVASHQIDIVIPRSTMPARMVLSMVRSIPDCKIVFDADGLPIEERVELAGLKPGSFRFRALKGIERRMVHRADRILTRTKKAATILGSQHGINSMDKFFVVRNGRDGATFKKASTEEIAACKAGLGIPEDALVLVYCGSLGPQYGLEEMTYVHRRVMEWNSKAYLLLVITNPEYAATSTLTSTPQVIVKSVPFREVPLLLSISHVALAIREPLYSMQGVAPIKIGEYLLTGLPVIASAGIGDTEEHLSNRDYAFLLLNHSRQQLDESVEWIKKLPLGETSARFARKAGEQNFELEQSVLSYETALRNL